MRNFYRLDAAEQREQSFQNLRTYLQEVVYPYSPSFRKTCKTAGIDPKQIKTYEDFQKIPLTTKHDYRAEPLTYILQPTFPGKPALYETAPISRKLLLKYALQSIFNWPRTPVGLYRKQSLKEKISQRACREWFPIHFHASSGSTGEPTPSVYTYQDMHSILPEMAHAGLVRADKYDHEDIFLSFDQKRMSLFPGAPHLAFFQAVLSKLFLGINVFDSFGGKVISTDRQIEIFSKGKFNTVGSIPSYLVYWLRRAVELVEAGKIQAFGPSFQGAVLGAEPVSASLKTHIHELAKRLGAHPRFKILQSYGSTEIKWAGIECQENSGMHLNQKYYFWEVLHPETKKPVAPGEPGVLVFSHIGWRGTVFTRYWTGDLVQGGYSLEPCPHCGHTFFRIHSPIARVDKDFTKVKGVQIPLQDLVTLLRDTKGVRNCQVILDKENQSDSFGRDLLVIRILPEKGIDCGELEAVIYEKVKDTIEVSPDKIVFENDPQLFEAELFSRTGIKAEYVVERRATL